MDTAFNEEAVNWLKRKGFTRDEIEDARNSLSVIRRNFERKGEASIKLPKGTSGRVASIVYAVAMNTDYDGRPIGFDKNGLIAITDGAKERFQENMEIGEYEEVLTRINKIKRGRTRSDPSSRTSVKKG